MKRIMISNLTVSSGAAQLPSIIAGSCQDHPIEDLKISDVYLHQIGGAGPDMAAIQPAENTEKYPEPTMFGDLPATGMYARHASNLELEQCRNRDHGSRGRPPGILSRQRRRRSDFFRLRAATASSRPVSSA